MEKIVYNKNAHRRSKEMADEDMMWECSNCGHIVVGKKAPEICPVCKHAKSYFMIHPTNY